MQKKYETLKPLEILIHTYFPVMGLFYFLSKPLKTLTLFAFPNILFSYIRLCIHGDFN